MSTEYYDTLNLLSVRVIIVYKINVGITYWRYCRNKKLFNVIRTRSIE